MPGVKGPEGWPRNAGPEPRVHPVAQETLSSPLYSCDNLLHLGMSGNHRFLLLSNSSAGYSELCRVLRGCFESVREPVVETPDAGQAVVFLSHSVCL